MKKPDTIVLLDDERLIVDGLVKWISLLPSASDLSLVGFTCDSKARDFVLQRRESILGYIQDVNRQPDIYDRSGVRFFNQTIDCLTPWAKTIVLSACSDMRVPIEVFTSAGDKLRSIEKSDVVGIETLAPHIDWLITPALQKAGLTTTEVASAVTILSPAWDKLCEYLAAHPDELHQLSPRDFEYLAGEVFRSYGWGVDFTARTRDGGYDVIATRASGPTDLCVLIQAKRFAPDRPVGVEIVRSLYGLRMLRSASQVVLVTSSYVTRDAKTEFQRVVPWELDFLERDRVLEWCKNYTSIRLGGHLDSGSCEQPN